MPSLLVPILCGGYAIGITLAAVLEGRPARAAFGLLALSLLAALLARRRPLLFVIVLLAASLLAGWTAGTAALRPSLPACDVSFHTGPDEVRLLAVVAGDPVPLPDGSERQELRAEALLERGRAAAPSTARFPSLAPSARSPSSTLAFLPLCGGVELHRPPGFAELTRGERVLMRGRLRLPGGGRNPGAPSARLRRLAAGVGAVLYGKPEGLVRWGAAPRAPVLSWLRARIRGALNRALPSGPRRQVVSALVLGDDAIAPEPRQAYARAGTSHVLSVSGLHLSLCALLALVLLRGLLLRLPLTAGHDAGRLAALPAAGLAVLYTLLAGAPPAACRACVMACAGFLALLLRRPPDLVRPLALAALVLLVWDPLCLFTASFQLSFLAVIGIGLMLAGDRDADPRPAGRARRLLRWVKDLLLASLAASLLTAPICAHHFHQVSLVGVLANLLAVPLTNFALLPASLLGGALGAVHPALGAPVLRLAGWLAAGLNAVSSAAARLPASSLPLHLGWLAALGALALAVALLVRGRERGRAWARRALLLLGVFVLVIAALVGLRRRAGGELELVFLDVGQGDSTFLRFPDGFSVLVDGGGSLLGADPGAAQVLPFLQAAGVRRLDLAVLSHPHPDHAAGLTTVIRELPVGELWVCWHDEPDPWLAALLEAARRRSVPVHRPRLLERSGVRVRPLWPAGYAGLCADPGYGANDNSVVLRVEHGRGAALLVGDIEDDAEQALLRARPGDLAADVLKVPHHGSAHSSSLAFLRAVSPRLAVISCRAQNTFGFPAPAALARYAALRVPLARIDEQGAIGVRLSAGGELHWEPLSGPVP